MIDKATIDKIFETADIVDVVSDYVTLKRRGVNYIGLCPFHNEKTPSFTVSPAKNICKCFGCGKGGNPVNFIMELENLSYFEALKFLAKKYHIEIEEKELTPEEIQKRNERESLMAVTEWIQQHFTSNLLNHVEGKAIGMSYFLHRGFREDIIKKFQLGYAIDKRDEYTQEAQKKGYKLDYLEKTGLTIVKENNYVIDRFHGRAIFPIHSISGKVIAFGGRAMRGRETIGVKRAVCGGKPLRGGWSTRRKCGRQKAAIRQQIAGQRRAQNEADKSACQGSGRSLGIAIGRCRRNCGQQISGWRICKAKATILGAVAGSDAGA